MIDLLVGGNNNDLILTVGDLTLVTESDQINQAISQALGMFYGEWFLDNRQGIPYIQQIFVKNPNLDIIQALLLNAIQNVPGVVQITSFAFTYNNANRNLGVTLSVQTTNGQTINVVTNTGIGTT